LLSHSIPTYKGGDAHSTLGNDAPDSETQQPEMVGLHTINMSNYTIIHVTKHLFYISCAAYPMNILK